MATPSGGRVEDARGRKVALAAGSRESRRREALRPSVATSLASSCTHAARVVTHERASLSACHSGRDNFAPATFRYKLILSSLQKHVRIVIESRMQSSS